MTEPEQTGQIAESVPLRVTQQTRSLNGYVCDLPSVVLLARVVERCEVEDVGFEGQSLTVPTFWTYAKAKVIRILRVNERRSDDPDLSSAMFLIEQYDRHKAPIRLEFGRTYLFLVKPSARMLAMVHPLHRSQSMDPYVPATAQVGFEVVAGTLRPLVMGGPLDHYNGWRLDDLIAEMQARP